MDRETKVSSVSSFAVVRCSLCGWLIARKICISSLLAQSLHSSASGLYGITSADTDPFSRVFVCLCFVSPDFTVRPLSSFSNLGLPNISLWIPLPPMRTSPSFSLSHMMNRLLYTSIFQLHRPPRSRDDFATRKLESELNFVVQ